MAEQEALFLVVVGAAAAAALLLTLVGCLIIWRLRRRALRWRVAGVLLTAAGAAGWVGYTGAKNWRNDVRAVPAGTARHWAAPFACPPLHNCYQVAPELYRSAQPDEAGVRAFAAAGGKTVINLRTLDHDRTAARAAGVRSVHIPARSSAISEEEIAEFLRAVSDPSNLPALVHCRHGSDRTGTMCAFYRILRQGWSREEALAELTLGGYGYHYVYDRSIPQLIRTADLDRIRRLAGIAGTR